MSDHLSTSSGSVHATVVDLIHCVWKRNYRRDVALTHISYSVDRMHLFSIFKVESLFHNDAPF